MIRFDTSFVIDLLRERRKGRNGKAHAFLSGLPGQEQVGISIHAVCELYVGAAHAKAPQSELPRVRQLLSTLSIVTPHPETFPHTYARLLTDLHRAETPVATMDLLIATAAVCASAPLVTGNPKHFHPIPELQVHTY